MVKSAKVQIYRREEFFIEIQKEKIRFKPGFPFKLTLLVREADGSVPKNSYEPLELHLIYNFKAKLCTPMSLVEKMIPSYGTTMRPQLKKGVAIVTLDIPANTTSFRLTATYCDNRKTIVTFRHKSSTREYLVATVQKARKGSKK